MLTGRKLLLADDSLTIQKVVSLTFNDEAMEVSTVGSGAAALEFLQASLPDIVLADVFMPEPNGYELCKLIKSDERTRHLPVVLLVGTFEPFNEAEARRVGADEVLTKPFQSIRDLVNKVGGLLGGSDEKNPNADDARSEQHEDEATRDLSPFAAAARAADPNVETAAEESAPAAADAFNDFDLDDATIQSTPAAAFDARREHPASDAFEMREEEQFGDRAGTDEAFVLGHDESYVQPQPAASTVASANSYAASSNAPAEAAPVAAATSTAFSTHAARAAEADDALLELGDDIAPARGGGGDATAANEADDFILDIGDEDSFEPVAVAPAAAHAATSAVAEADMHFAAHAPLAEVMTNEFAEEPETSGSPVAFAESSVAVAPFAPASSHAEVEEEAQLTPHDEVAASVAETSEFMLESAPVEAESESRPSMVAAADESSPAVATATAASEASGASSSASLSPEMLDEVVRRVVAHMSEQVVREIAWEVVPDLAERLIKQRLEEEKTRPAQ